ncbi:PREDICTED: claudin-7 isoform X1 [Condylura cristata]|uniref:claudin-7 isoform X1 n=1 Tax=Condylura cristata TaxID=143302 RepID=UPI000643BCCE|nr:PREDICTED: claudin-7 isoform X1 [Condylura cristata]
MANSGLQLLGFSMALIGWVGLLASTAIPKWQMSSYAGDNIITSQAIYKGLWMECVTQSTGLISCKIYDSVLALPVPLQATRALMVVSLVLGCMAMIVATMGMKCTNCGGDNKTKKARIAMTGGIIFIVAGLSLVLPSLLAGQGQRWSSWEVHCYHAPVLGVRTRLDTGRPAPTLSPILPRNTCELGPLCACLVLMCVQATERTQGRDLSVEASCGVTGSLITPTLHIMYSWWEDKRRGGCVFCIVIKSVFWKVGFAPLRVSAFFSDPCREPGLFSIPSQLKKTLMEH